MKTTYESLLKQATALPYATRPTGMILSDVGNVHFIARVQSHGDDKRLGISEQDHANALLLTHSANRLYTVYEKLKQMRVSVLSDQQKGGLSDSGRIEVQRQINDAISEIELVQE